MMIWLLTLVENGVRFESGIKYLVDIDKIDFLFLYLKNTKNKFLKAVRH